MPYQLRRIFGVLSIVISSLFVATATTIPTLTFEQLTDSSEVVAAGNVTRSWASWDSEHKYIWTHYLLSVHDLVKGSRDSQVEFAEPGGVLEDVSMMIPGAVIYGIGEHVLVFLAKMPNGYLRTAGWAQGKYSLDSQGRLHGLAARGADSMAVDTAPVGRSLRTLEGMSLAELKKRVADRGKNH